MVWEQRYVADVALHFHRRARFKQRRTKKLATAESVAAKKAAGEAVPRHMTKVKVLEPGEIRSA